MRLSLLVTTGKIERKFYLDKTEMADMKFGRGQGDQRLTVETLKKEAKIFADKESTHNEPSMYGITDGKAIGTYFERKFQSYLKSKYRYEEGSSAKGIDFPGLSVDIKITSIKQPQSSCPFKSINQKIYGLGYSLLVFVYEKRDNTQSKTGRLNILHSIFVEEEHTADFQITTQLNSILDNDGNIDDIIALLTEKHLPADDIMINELAKYILKNRPRVGYLTISNALQWRLQYSRIIENAGQAEGVVKIK